MLNNATAHFLITEGEEKLRDAFQDLLIGEGFKVRTAENGKEAIQQAISYKPDLIILDIILPLLNGVEIC